MSAKLNGTIDEGLAGFLPGADVTFAALEVGTVALEPMIRALRLANWQDHFAADDARAAEIAKTMRETFYTDTPAWKQAVWALGERAVHQALNAL